MSITLETDRLVLRPFAAADAAAVQVCAGRWEIASMTTRIAHPYPEGAAAEWIAGHAALREQSGEYVFCLSPKSGEDAGQAIGATSLRALEAGNLELGYWLAAEHWGRGLATEAARAMVVFGFEKLGAEAINSGHFIDNPASGRVLEKAGLRGNGMARQWSAARRDFVDAQRYLLTRESWQKARAHALEQKAS
jgi:RimJ/RimL family protein N-acetyltransferase